MPQQGQVCLIWGFGSFVHLCLDSVGQYTFLDSLLCASSGSSPVPVWRWTRGEGSCAATLGVNTGLCRGRRVADDF